MTRNRPTGTPESSTTALRRGDGRYIDVLCVGLVLEPIEDFADRNLWLNAKGFVLTDVLDAFRIQMEVKAHGDDRPARLAAIGGD